MVEINLLPKEQRAQTQTSIWKYLTWALLPITAAALLIPWIMTSGQTSRLQAQIDAEQATIDALSKQKTDYDALVLKQQQLEAVTGIAQTLRDQKTYWSNDLAAFSAQIPASAGVTITSLTMAPVLQPATPAATPVANASTTPAPAGSTPPANGAATGTAAPTATTPAAAPVNMQNGYGGKVVRREMVLAGTASNQQAIINFLNRFENNPNFGVKFQGMQAVQKNQPLPGQPQTPKDYTFTATVGVVGIPPVAATTSTAVPTAPAPTSTGGVASMQREKAAEANDTSNPSGAPASGSK